MPLKGDIVDRTCVGGCGHAVANSTTCRTCSMHLHPGCSSKHLCPSKGGNVSRSGDDPLHAMIRDIQVSMLNLNKRLDDQVSSSDRIEVLLQEIKCLREENNSLKRTVNDLSARMVTLESAVVASGNDVLFDVLNEVEERRFRETNLIVYDMPESTNMNLQTRIDDDKALVLENLSVIKPGLHINKVVRLGKKRNDGLPRPLKVVLESAHDVKCILREKSKVSTISIKSDDTPKQRSYLRSLKDQLKTRVESGEQNLTIRFKNNIPSIVTARSVSEN